MNGQRPKRVTRQDVARYAGVSPAVVSYVVNAAPRSVAPETRQRVLEAIRVLGYRPNAAARALKLGSTQLLGLIVPDTANPFFAEIADGIGRVADVHGMGLLLASSNRNTARERDLVQRLLSRQVDGLILASTESDPDLSAADALGTPVVLLDRADPSETQLAIGVDYRGASKMAVEHLISHGHSNIGLVVGDGPSKTAADREAGWVDALLHAGLREGPVARVEFTRAGGYDAGKRLLNQVNRPTAVFVSSDMQAMGVLRALHEAQVPVPEEMAVISFDGTVETEYSWPALTTMKQPVSAIAEAAVNLLIRGKASSRDWIKLPMELVLRASCGKHE